MKHHWYVLEHFSSSLSIKHTDNILIANCFLLQVNYSLKNKLTEPQYSEYVDNCQFILTVVFHLEIKSSLLLKHCCMCFILLGDRKSSNTYHWCFKGKWVFLKNIYSDFMKAFIVYVFHRELCQKDLRVEII